MDHVTAQEAKSCDTCGAPLRRRRFPSGRIEGPAMYAKRRYCSTECSAAAKKGQSSWRLAPTPEKFCENCGGRMERNRTRSGLLETLSAFAKRQTCSIECRAELPPRNHRPHSPGRRTLLARTCKDCGRLKPGAAFPPNVRGYRDTSCYACRASAWRQNRSEERRDREKAEAIRRQRERWTQTLAEARHWGDDWTGPELELVAARNDLSVTDLALMLGRTYGAVVAARARIQNEPREQWLSGL